MPTLFLHQIAYVTRTVSTDAVREDKDKAKVIEGKRNFRRRFSRPTHAQKKSELFFIPS
jgi:hypothetical protein